eukprot:TRINITY_DN16637_c0_g1_i2.p1 TRINITY_DN16637_c0_g1~~TRINITY_DN16637_c0_g1_i2.p1  ORF type:complete len:328 (-),score=78.62 TRINITY_DN16637_c0_g1_i2:403-1386(-)
MSWEKEYLKRLGKAIHRLVCAELDSFEESLFILFVRFDTNLDGHIAGSEVPRFLEALEKLVSGATAEAESKLMMGDGKISFIKLIRWIADAANDNRLSAGFRLSSMSVGMLGSAAIVMDERLEKLNWCQLRQNVYGYRKLLQKIRKAKQDDAVDALFDGEDAGFKEHYNLVSGEMDGDMKHLFELFCETDTSHNLRLESHEIVVLFQRFDAQASSAELLRYFRELNMRGNSLTFVSFCDWWHQAQQQPASLVSEKGVQLLAAMKAKAASRSLATMFTASSSERHWQTGVGNNKLAALKTGYLDTYEDLRQYKLFRMIRDVETQCVRG